MEELINTADQVNAMLDGNLKANDVNEMAQSWIQISVVMFALDVARAPKEHRKELLKTIEKEQPLFIDDVRQCAKAIISGGHDTIPF